MSDERLETLVRLLEEALRSGDVRPLVPAIQQAIWATAREEDAGDDWDVLLDLAYDLDFYEPDAGRRAESGALLDDAQAIAEIQLAVERLRKGRRSGPAE